VHGIEDLLEGPLTAFLFIAGSSSNSAIVKEIENSRKSFRGALQS
jgi:hypothetical protein